MHGQQNMKIWNVRHALRSLMQRGRWANVWGGSNNCSCVKGAEYIKLFRYTVCTVWKTWRTFQHCSLALVSSVVHGAILYSGLGNVIRGNIVNIPTYDVWNVVSQQLQTTGRCVTLRLCPTDGTRTKSVLK